MTTGSFKKPFLVLSVITLILTVLYGKCVWDHTMLSIRMSFAEEQIKIIEDMRVKASQSEISEAVEYLEYALNYYPSGTKQIQGSRLDRIVESARANAVARIICDLRSRTGEDFGDDPHRWINRK